MATSYGKSLSIDGRTISVEGYPSKASALWYCVMRHMEGVEPKHRKRALRNILFTSELRDEFIDICRRKIFKP